MQRKSIVGTRSSLLWLLILIVVLLVIGVTVVGLVIVPQLQTTRAEQAHLAEIERHYQAGATFQNVGDWAAAEAEYKLVILADAGYKDTRARLAEVNQARQAGLAAVNATATAQARSDLETRYQRGLAYMNLERWEEAAAELERVLAIDPAYREVQTKLSEVASRLAVLRKLTPTAQSATSTPYPTYTPYPTLAVPPQVFYDDAGSGANEPHLVRGTAFNAWRNLDPNNTIAQNTIRYDNVAVLYKYAGLKASVRYRVKVTYLQDKGEKRVQTLTADDSVVHSAMPLPDYTARIYEFDLPPESYRDGTVTLSFNHISGGNAVVSEIWIVEVAGS